MTPTAAMDRDDLALRLAEVARVSAAVLLRMRAVRDATLKADGSPVCSADLAADHTAKAALARLLPDLPVISEESVGETKPGAVFVLLDPLDGTREFLAGGEHYCVAVAVIAEGRPIAGAIAAPALGQVWFAGDTAHRQRFAADGAALGGPESIAVRALPSAGPVTLVSRFHGDAVSSGVGAALKESGQIAMSSAVKFGLIACGEADLHVRNGATMEWDIAAGDVILSVAGGVVRMLDGSQPRYGRVDKQFRNRAFVAASSEALAQRAIAAAADLM